MKAGVYDPGFFIWHWLISIALIILVMKIADMKLLYTTFAIFISLSSDAQNLKSGGRLSDIQANMDIKHYSVQIDVDTINRSFTGNTGIKLNLKQSTRSIDLDLTDLMKISSLTVDGSKTEFTHDSNKILIRSKAQLKQGPHKIEIKYSGIPAIAARPPWEGGIQWARDSSNKLWISQSCQGEGAKIFFPCKDHPGDEPDHGADLIVTVPKGMVVAGPGVLKSKRDRDNRSTYHWSTSYPINNYCIVFNAGDYEVVSKPYKSLYGNTVPMEFYVLKQDLNKAPKHLELLERSCRILEKYFGEYPWIREKIGIVQTPHLGMEHQTMNAYGNKFKYTKVGGHDFDWLLHHEFGHEWWANKVSNSDWAHMWIQEGIDVFGDALAIRELEGEEAYQKKMRDNASASQNKLPIVQGESVDSDQTYTGDIYVKGAYFMHGLRAIMGDSIFFPALMKFIMDPAYTYANTVTTADVERHFSKAYGQSLEPFFRLMLYTVEKIRVSVKKTTDNTYEVKLENLAMPIPLEIQTNEGLQRKMVSTQPVSITSTSEINIDPKGYFMKEIIK